MNVIQPHQRQVTYYPAMNNLYTPATGDLFQEDMDRKTGILEKVQAELAEASARLVTRMAKGMAVALNKSMSSYVDEVLAYRRLNFIDQISIKHQTMDYAEMQIGFEEELDARMDTLIEALSQAEWLLFQFRDAALYYEQGKEAVVVSVKRDILETFGHLLDEHFATKRMQGLLQRHSWLMK